MNRRHRRNQSIAARVRNRPAGDSRRLARTAAHTPEMTAKERATDVRVWNQCCCVCCRRMSYAAMRRSRDYPRVDNRFYVCAGCSRTSEWKTYLYTVREARPAHRYY